MCSAVPSTVSILSSSDNESRFQKVKVLEQTLMSSCSSFRTRLYIEMLGFRDMMSFFFFLIDKGSLFTPKAEMVCLSFATFFLFFKAKI